MGGGKGGVRGGVCGGGGVVISPNLPQFPRGQTCVHCFVFSTCSGIIGVDRRRDGGGGGGGVTHSFIVIAIGMEK